jgi:hypothetical protein
VIGIIAVLVSLLLPALNKARDSAKTVQCQSNLKHLGAFMLLYANDNKGWVPIAKYSKTAATPPVTPTNVDITWIEPLLKYVEPVKFKNIDMPNLDQLSDRSRSILFGCPPWMEIWKRSGAPSIVGTDPARSIGYGMNIFPKAPTSYGGWPAASGTLTAPADLNWFDPAIGRNGRYTKISEWKNPSQRAMLGDTRGGPQMYVNSPVSAGVWGTTTIHPRHAKERYTNMVMWDGSGQTMTLDEARYSVRLKMP